MKDRASCRCPGAGRLSPILAAIALTLGLGLSLGPAAWAVAPITLRANDAEAEAGATVAVVLRTYEPRAVGQGQICFSARLAAGDGAGLGVSPFVGFSGVTVFSEEGDVEYSGTFTPGNQTAVLQFLSASATVNTVDGPMAVFYFQLDPALSPGEVFVLDLDLAETFLIDDNGDEIPLDLRDGDLLIRVPGAPHAFEADGAAVAPGALANIPLETHGLFAIGSGQATLLYDPAVIDGPPLVTMDPRYGTATFTADTSVPGEVVVQLDSLDGSLNSSVPGGIIVVSLPTAAGVAVGTQSPVQIDAARTFFLDPSGAAVPLVVEGGVIEFLAGGAVFFDGFESGGFSAWDQLVPPPAP